VTIKPIASGSTGNCYLIDDGSSQLLIECGINIDRIKKEIDLKKVSGCLITHEHKDHAKAAQDILKICIPIYASRGTLKEINNQIYTYRQHELIPERITDIGTFKVLPFKTEHDSIDPLGFLIYSTETNERLLFATDTYYIKPTFAKLNYIMLECNYAKDILQRNIDSGKIPIVVAKRLWKSHFELENVKSFLKANDLAKVKTIYLMHLSSGNSDAKRFEREIQQLTGIPVIVCQE
jgi:phosphoribosyl 1,2-cyclic phosphodiesterase